ncbi:MAG TPA: MarR family transcriptional regulator, partial [Thermoleophilia bacterium]|nr:MarR family transcriptional regulator [Thermoleophilia bacterium]
MVKAAPEFKMTVPDLQGVDDLSSHVFRAFLGTARMHMQLMMRTMAETGTHPGQAMCLRLLTVNDGISQRDLADVLNVARPTVTRMLQGMEKAGLIERRADEADQRLTRVFLTGAGRAAEKQMGVAAGAGEEHAREPLICLVRAALDETRLLHPLQHPGDGGACHVQHIGQVPLGDTVADGEQPQAHRLAGVRAALGHRAHHE